MQQHTVVLRRLASRLAASLKHAEVLRPAEVPPHANVLKHADVQRQATSQNMQRCGGIGRAEQCTLAETPILACARIGVKGL